MTSPATATDRLTVGGTVTVNAPLLHRTLAHIEAYPEEWDQETWRCGTTMCFGSLACNLAEGIWYSSPDDGPNRWLLLAEDADEEPYVQVFNGVRVIEVLDRAQRLLGLSVFQAADLFSVYNTLEDLRRIVAELTRSAS